MRLPYSPILKLSCITLIVSTALLSNSCARDSSSVTGPRTGSVAEVHLSATSLSLNVYDTLTLTADVRDANGNSLVGHAVSWTSSDTSVATVSKVGGVQAVAIGAATIIATSDGKSGTASISVTPTMIRDCSTIKAPGNYVVTGDIGGPRQPRQMCLNIENTSDVSIDCAGHKVWGVGATQVVGFSLSRCVVEPFDLVTQGAVSFLGDQLTAINIDRNDFSAGFFLTNGPGTISNNTFSNLGITIDQTSGVDVVSNLIEFHPRPDAYAVPPWGILIQQGTGNRVAANTIDGGWDGDIANWGALGADDGIVLIKQSQAIVEDNVIRNTWDAGIESGDSVFNSTIRNNNISDTDIGIGAWWNSNLSGNVYSGNTVTRANSLATFFFAQTINGTTQCAFSDNQFLNNRFTEPVVREGHSYSNGFGFPASCPVQRNTVRNNDFAGLPVVLVPASGFNQ